MKIDIDRLHKIKESDRLAGNTTDMLIAAAQNSDFYHTQVVITGYSTHYAQVLLGHFIKVCGALDIPVIKYHSFDNYVVANGVVYTFLSRMFLEMFIEGRDVVVFDDHF